MKKIFLFFLLIQTNISMAKTIECTGQSVDDNGVHPKVVVNTLANSLTEEALNSFRSIPEYVDENSESGAYPDTLLSNAHISVFVEDASFYAFKDDVEIGSKAVNEDCSENPTRAGRTVYTVNPHKKKNVIQSYEQGFGYKTAFSIKFSYNPTTKKAIYCTYGSNNTPAYSEVYTCVEK